MLDNHGYPPDGTADWDESATPGTIAGAPAGHLPTGAAWHLPAGAAQPAGTQEQDAVTIALQPIRSSRADRVALRIGVVAGVAALIVAGTAFTMAAAPSPGAGTGGLVAAASAAPSPDASTSPDAGGGWGRGGMGGGRREGPRMGGFGGGGPMMGVGPTMGGWSNQGQPGGRMRGGQVGAISITAISGDSLSLKTEDGWTRTIAITAATTITKAGATITPADLAVGDTIRFSETRTSDGTFTIDAIQVVVPQARGSVTAADANGFTIKDRGGISRAVTVNGSTVYALGAKTGTKADVTVGIDVIVAGPQASDSSITALRVTIILPRVLGTLTAIASDGFTITRPDGTTLKVNVGSDTTFQVAGKTAASLSDVSAGMTVLVTGTQRSDGSLDAQAVVAGQGRFGRGGKGNGPAPASPAPSASPSTSG